jgi:hypothetical protein
MYTSRFIVVVTLAAIGLIFVLERLPGGSSAAEWLYVVPVTMIALWSSPRDVFLVVGTAGTATLLSLADFPVSAISETHCSGLMSHLLVVGAIWLTVALSLLRKRKERTTQWIGLFPASS